MFKKIRKPVQAKNIASYIIFGLICLVFVFIGVPVNQMSNMGGTALIVNNKVISWSKYRSYLEMLEQQQSAGSSGTDLGARRQNILRKRAIETLLNQELIAQEAVDSGFAISPKAVRDKIVALPFFQEEGRFMYSIYQSFLSARRFSAAYFENLIREEIQSTRFQRIFNMAVMAGKMEEKKRHQLESFEVEVSYIQFPFTSLELAEFNSVKKTVQAGDMNLLDQFVQDKKWKWEQTGSFNLNHLSLPGLESHKVLFDEMFNHLPNTGVIGKIISVRDQSFILKVNSFVQRQEKKTGKENTPHKEIFPSGSSLFANRIAAQMVFLSWTRFARLSSKIKFNPRLQIEEKKAVQQ